MSAKPLTVCTGRHAGLELGDDPVDEIVENEVPGALCLV